MNRERLAVLRLSLWHCLLPLLIGLVVYIFFRKGSYLNAAVTDDLYFEIKSPLLSIIIFSLPDFCWSYSFASALFLVSIYYGYRIKKSSGIIFLLITVSELIQLLFPHYFTFDLYDLIAAILAFVLSYLLFTKLCYEKVFKMDSIE
jgi:hypothetical protein